MEQRIEYKGMTSKPSDYQSEDGEMKLAVNAEYRDGGYHAVRIPKDVMYHKDGFEPMFVHKVEDKTIIIGFESDGAINPTYKLSAYELNVNTLGDENLIKDDIATEQKFDDICATGKIISFVNEGKLCHLVYQSQGACYLYLVGLPDFINIHFKAVRQNLRSKEWAGGNTDYKTALYNHGFRGWTDAGCNTVLAISDTIYKGGIPIYFVRYSSKEMSIGLSRSSLGNNNKSTAETKGNFEIAENFILSAVNSTKKELDKKGLFMYPVVLRYAMKMYDGNYINISPPILVFPSNDSPTLIVKNEGAVEESSSDTEKTKFIKYVIKEAYVGFEAYQIECKNDGDTTTEISNNLNNLRKWQDLIASIDIFVSKPLYTIDTDELDIERTLKLDGANDSDFKLVFKKKLGYKEAKDIQNFYLVRSFPIREYLDGCKDWNNIIEKDKQTLVNYTEGTQLTDNSFSSQNIQASRLYSFNSRLVAANIRKMHMSGLDISIEAPLVEDSEKNTSTEATPSHADVINKKYIDINTGNVSSAFCEVLFDTRNYKKQIGNIEVNEYRSSSYSKCKIRATSKDFNNSSLRIPLFITIPESKADRLSIVPNLSSDTEVTNVVNAKALVLQLNQSDFLNVSYCFNEKNEIKNAIINTTQTQPGYDLYSLPNRDYEENRNLVKISEVNNPFVFKDGNSAQCGEGTVLSLASNSRAVSQGQFGQYPLYAFCTDGVYAIGVGTDGTLQNCSPFSYDILSDANSVSNMESSVVFVTKQGIISLGGEGRQLLLPADPTATYDYDTCKGNHQATFIQKAFTNVLHLDAVPQMVDLYTYLTTGARIAYDYPHGRLIVYNQKHNYSYVMEAASGMWSIMTQGFHSNLNVYEECLMVKEVSTAEDHTQYKVYNYSSDKVVEAQKAYLITRPFKLGYPDVHKTLHSLIQRGVFCSKDDVKQALYGSNDLYNWVPVWSSSNIYLRGFRGTGYKYYRLMLFLPEFKQNETLQGTTITFAPRMTDMQR